MRKLLNTLYITTDGSYLHRDGETVAVEREGAARIRIPIHGLEGIVCMGNVMMSPHLMALCAEKQVAISFLSSHGRFLSRVQGPVTGNVLLRRRQYRMADQDEGAAALAQSMVMAKLANCRSVLLRAQRERSEPHPELAAAIAQLGSATERLLARQESAGTLRGVEGDAARTYFSVFDHLIVAQKDDFCFRGRSRRPPLDNVNALLSFAYAILTHETTAALESVGLDPYVGFLHTDRPGRQSLALDLVEEMRPAIADRLVLTLINRQQIQSGDFEAQASGAVLLKDTGRKKFLEAWQKRKQEELRHPFLDEVMSLGLFPYAQALLMARHIRGDLDGYPAWVAK